MATITPTLTLVSSDALVDTLSISVTDTITALGPCSHKKVTVGTSGLQISADADDKKKYFFIKNHGTAAVTCDSDGAGAASIGINLEAGEWAWFPWGAASDDLFIDATEDTVVEIISFQAVA